MEHDAAVTAWLARLPEDKRREAAELSDLVQQAADRLEESVKWGRLTFTVDGNWHHWLCAIGATKTAVKVMFHKGALLDDPSSLLEGDGRYLRQLPHDVAMAHPEGVIRLVQDAIIKQTALLDN